MIRRLSPRSLDRPPAGDARKRCGVWNFVATVQLLAAALVLLAGCGNSGDPPGYFNGGAGGETGVTTPRCSENAERECGIILDQEAGLVTCYRGVQFCEDGMWSECVDGEVTTEPDWTSLEHRGSFRRYEVETLSTAAAAACTPTQACDPYCYEFAESMPTLNAGSVDNDTELCDPAEPPLNTECTAIPGCEHSLCTTGAGLTNSTTCGTCVAKVCGAPGNLPGCCGTSGSWTQACINKAMEVCQGAPPPLGLCDYGLFSENGMTFGDRPALGGSTVGANGNVDFGTNSITKFPSRIIVKGDLWIRSPGAGIVAATGGIWASGSVGFEAGGGTTWNTDIHAGEGVYLFNNNNVTGKVYTSANYANSAPNAQPGAGSAFNISGSSNTSTIATGYATNTTTAIQPAGSSAVVVTSKQVNPFPALTPANIVVPSAIPGLPAPCASGTCPGSTVPAYTTDLTVNAGGNYGNVSLSSGYLILNGAGTYSFKSLRLTGNNLGIRLSPATGQYVVVVEGAFQFGGDGNKVLPPTGTTVITDPTRLIVHVGSTASGACSDASCAAYLGNNANFVGIVSVPNGTAAVGNTVTVRGAVWGSAVKGNPDFALTTITPTECATFNLPGTTPPSFTCPSTLDTGFTFAQPAVPPSSVETCRSGADCQMNQRCTNVDSRVTAVSCLMFDKCVASGGAVPPLCQPDPCIARVVAAQASCLSTWNASCVALIPAQCDATCSTTGTRTGICTSNAGFSGEAGCTGYDLSLGYACVRDSIPVCNHGSANFSGNVTVGYWNINKRKFANNSPGTPDGSCTQNLTINAGTCTPMTSCTSGSAPPSGPTYTYMVDPPTSAAPNGVLSECGGVGNFGRRLDNWSWHNPLFTCSNQPDFAEYEYVANCPADSQARWKYLRWVTDNNTGTQVVFRGKVAKNLAGLAAVPSYTLLDTNTTDCTAVDANNQTAACSEQLTTALGLPWNQGQALSIRIERTGAAVVTSWDVTYTCVYDQ